MMVDDELLERINSLNFKQHDAFNAVHKLSKEYAKHKGISVKLVRVFFRGNGSTGKFRLVKMIYNVVLKTFPFFAKNLENHSPVTGTNGYVSSKHWWDNN